MAAAKTDKVSPLPANTAPSWISTEDRLPDKDQWYVGVSISVERDLVTGMRRVTYVLDRGYPGYTEAVKRSDYWYPLPPPPLPVD